MNEKTLGQLRVIGEVQALLADAGDIRWWLFGGCGLDARIGRVTRDHGDFSLQGRWSDWVLPADSFDASPGRLDELTAPAMSVAGMLAMKEQFRTLRNGRPLRDKDVRDIAVLRELADTPT